MFLNGGGGQPLSTKLVSFFKGKKDTVCSEMVQYVFERISSYFDFFPSKSYVLDHSGSIDLKVEK